MSRVLRFLPIFTLILLSLLFFYKLAFSDMILARGDTYHYFYPYWDLRNAAFRAGELPLWTPNIFMGAPLLADPQIGVFYPPNWLMTPFTAPDGIRYSILLHVAWAAIGTFLLFRRLVNPALFPALVAATIFALGGYLGAHVEQINQLQGLSYLPILLYLLHCVLQGERRWFWLFLLAITWALQIFSGHTQTTFLTGVALGIFALSYPQLATNENFKLGNYIKQAGLSLCLLAVAAFSAVLLAIPQLLPTLELIGMSNRGGGLNANEATAFSLPPWYLGRALLPSYDGQLFGEYIGYIGVIALVLAIYGAISRQANKGRPWFWIILTVLGIFFALGRANPIYFYLAEFPGFSFFRVPARWMALYALGTAMLAGYGLLALQTQALSWKRLGIAVFAVLGLMLAAWRLPIAAEDIVGAAQVTMSSFVGWGLALVALALGIVFIKRYPASSVIGLSIAITLELFLAAQIMPYNELVPRDLYLGQRFTISQMLAYTEGQIPPPRTLSISARVFDVGDIASLQARYEALGMDSEAQATAFTAIKSQEMLFPNLALTWNIPSIDGYGGGLLPTIYYSQFSSLLLPENSLRSVDGRLGELMALPECRGACIPNLAWLQATGTRYLLTNKIYDIPVDDVFYDTAFTGLWGQGVNRPDFEFTELRVLLHDASILVFDWDAFQAYLSINPEQILAVSAVDNRTGAFLQLSPAGIERVLSSDIKIYDLGAVSRAYLANKVQILPDDWQAHEDTLALMQAEEFIPLQTAVIHGDAEVLSGIGDISFTNYSPTRIEITVTTNAEAYLILNDAYYPGWQASVNGEESPVYRANVLFRAVRVPAGTSAVIFEFVPTLWYGAMIFGAVIWILLGGITFFLWRKGRPSLGRP